MGSARVAFGDEIGMEEMKDLDDLTDNMLLKEKSTWSKAKFKRMRIMSVITGNYVSRKKIFTEVQEHADFKIYDISVLGKTIPCAKVFNPAILERNSKTWSKLTHVQRFELEDPEGMLTTVPKHYATNMEHLESFSITWTRVKSLPNELFREGLKTLSLPRNQLKTLNGVEKAEDLSNLDVSSNMLTELPKTFGHLHNLTTLNISGNAIRELPENFGSLSQLRMLDCSCNRLSSLPDSIENLLELMSLDVCNNLLVALPETIGNLPKLEDFRARGNQLQSLPHRFERLSRLSSLILRKNKFEEVPPQLSKISSLQSLNMRENSIRSFPKAIPSLKTLILDSNQLTEISNGILECTNVQMLSLENNEISSIPRDILRLRNLRLLHLSGNDITEVPECIECLAHLRHLSLRATKIRRLPAAIVRMDGLARLDIDDCRELEDRYLIKELRDNGIRGLKAYLMENGQDESPVDVPLRDYGDKLIPNSRPTWMPDQSSSSSSTPVLQNGRISQMPPSGSTAGGREQHQQQQVQLMQASRGTMFSPMARAGPHLSSTQQLMGQTLLAELKSARAAEKGDCSAVNLSAIRESQTDEDQEDGTTQGLECQYGVVNKKGLGNTVGDAGGRGGGQRVKPDEDEGDRLYAIDSEDLLHEGLLAKNNRQSMA